MEKLGLPYITYGNGKLKPHEKTVWQFHKKNKISTHLPFDLAIAPLGLYPRSFKACVHRKTYAVLFTVALLVVAQTRNNQNAP